MLLLCSATQGWTVWYREMPRDCGPRFNVITVLFAPSCLTLSAHFRDLCGRSRPDFCYTILKVKSKPRTVDSVSASKYSTPGRNLFDMNCWGNTGIFPRNIIQPGQTPVESQFIPRKWEKHFQRQSSGFACAEIPAVAISIHTVNKTSFS